jgi:hypothetical protein
MSTHNPSSSVTTETFNLLVEKLEHIESKLRILEHTKVKESAKSAKSVKSDSTSSVRKPRKMTEKSALVSAKWMFYQEFKDDKNIINSIRNGLVQGNMLVKKTKVIDGQTIEVDNIPYQPVKIATDLKFNSVSDDIREKYINMAWMKYAAKNV